MYLRRYAKACHQSWAPPQSSQQLSFSPAANLHLKTSQHLDDGKTNTTLHSNATCMSMQVVFLIPIFSSTQTYFHLVYQWPGKLCYQICKLYLSTSINESLETHPRVSQPPLIISGFIHFWQILFLAKWRMNGFSSCHSLFRDFLSNFGRYLSSSKNPKSVSSLKSLFNVEYFYVKNGASIFLKSESF